MDEGPQLLTNFLTSEDLEQTPKQVQEKLKNYLDKFFDDYYQQKAAAHRLHDYEKKTEELQSQIQDYEVKLQNYNQNVQELRAQLDSISAERTNLLSETTRYEKELNILRTERNGIADERDALMKVIDRQNNELDRLQQDVSNYKQQLKSAINAKCEAIARVDEIESKETALDFKERRMEQERAMLQNQIQTLSEDLNRNITDLQNIRRENVMQGMHLEARLSEKIEELKIAQTQCIQYKETIDKLTQSVQDLSSKLLDQNEEANKMMDYYKKELEAKSKLAELYKSNCDDTVVERSELETAITELKRMLSEASDEFGQLETRFKATTLKHAQELEEKDKLIDSLKAEIEHANDLLKEVEHESVENAISKLAPSAAVASRLIRSDMSLTELYSLYVKTSEDLELQKRENGRVNLQLKSILHELTENAPIIKKQELEYEKLIETTNILEQQRDELLGKKKELEDMLVEANAQINHVERENKGLRHSQTDLSRQVCYLLKEVEQLRIGLVADMSIGSHTGNMSTSDEVISKKLVTFSSIPDLQENNQKLLLLVRDLSYRMEELEQQKLEFNEAAYKDKVQQYMTDIYNMQETLNQQTGTVTTLVTKCERYKRMYFDLQKQFNRSGPAIDLSDMEEDIEMNETTANNKTAAKKDTDPKAEKRVSDLEQQLHVLKDQYKTLKDQYEYYTQEKKNNEKILNEQFDSMRTEVRELTSTNCKLMSSVEYNKEQIKLQQKNIATYKQQIAALEDRNKNYETTIIKHEQTVLYLKDEIMKAQRSQSTAESEANHLRHENRILKDTTSRLQTEKESLHREQQNQNLLLNNLELIKSNLERSETEGRMRLEQRLDDTVREMSAQRRRFQEEEDRFRETTADLQKQTEIAKQRMEEESKRADKLRAELVSLREEQTAKTKQVDELSKKLQQSLTPTNNDNPIVLANKKAREFEVKWEQAKLEVASLTSEVAKLRQHSEQYYKMSQSAETEIKSLHEVHTTFTSKAQAEIKQLQLSEQNLKARVTELEAELQLATVIDNVGTNQLPEQLKRSQDELKDTLQKLSECNRNLRTLRSENNTLTESLNAVETKYANEMVLHSADIQELTKLKAQMTKIQDQINELKSDRDNARSAFDELKSSQSESLILLEKEKNELEARVSDLNGLTASLHDQIEALSSKLAIQTQSQNGGSITNTSINDSAYLADTSGSNELSRSTMSIDDESKNSDKLLQIIKFLRKEKDLMVAKVDILKAENKRLLSENTILQKKIDELNGFLNQERSNTETSIISATKHEEILRKIETLNAMTDSNRILREERNSLSDRVRELNSRITEIEDELFPLQSQNREHSARIEELSSENSSLRTEALKWRQRANLLVEKSNKNPEEFKRLQMERENLAKMLTNEKEHHRQASEELAAIKAEKARLDAELLTCNKQLIALTEEKRKQGEDYHTLKLNSARIVQEVMELKNKLLQKEEAMHKLVMELDSKEAQLQDSKNKEVQIRKIAKRYKDSYLDLSNKSAAMGADSGSMGQENVEMGAANSVTEPMAGNNANELEECRTTIDGLNERIRTLQAENDKMIKEYEDIKASAGLEDQTKSLLVEARSRIVNLTESKTALTKELAATKSKLQTAMQSAENRDATISGIKCQYEETLTRKEKEFLDQINLSKEAMARLTRENESLHMRNQQLSRQLGMQQSAKPSTSSVAITDKGISESSPRTANVKPMSGSATVQQSATVTPWRGSETPLASIRPISVQNSRTAAILPTSQQTVATGGSSSSTSTSSTSTPSSNAPTSAACSNTALVPPQQQVHTTGSSSLEAMSSSPTSSHTDYMPSTSTSTSVAVATIPPMGSASASAAESSQEAESIQQPQQNESQVLVSGGQPQAVALVSPRVEASSQNVPSPQLQLPQDPNNQQPSTSGTTSSSSHIAVSSHTRHTPSSSNVTTTQAGSSGCHKRPRDSGDSFTDTEDCGGADKSIKHPKRMRTPNHGGEATALVGVTDSGLDVEYQVPTSSQRDQEDDIVVVDSDDDDEDEEEEDGMAEADDGPTDPDADHEGYEDSYEQDQDVDENECPEINNEANIRAVDVEPENNEVEVDECIENQAQCTSGLNNQGDLDVDGSNGASTSQAAAAALAHSQSNHQQSQAISSGSYEPSDGNIPQPGPPMPWKQASTSTLTRQQKATLMMLQQGMAVDGNERTDPDGPSGSRRSDGSTEIVSSPQGSKFGYAEQTAHSEAHDSKAAEVATVDERIGSREEFVAGNDYAAQKKSDETATEESKTVSGAGGSGVAAGAGTSAALGNVEDIEDGDEDFAEETGAVVDPTENIDSESHHSSGATQSQIQDIQQNQVEATSAENEGVDGVSSEGEKPAVAEEMEEEGREAEATTTPCITTRSKAIKSATATRRPSRGFQRGGRPTPIIWQESPGNSRNAQMANQRNLEHMQQQQQQQSVNQMRGYPSQRNLRGRRMRRPSAGNYGNMRYS